MSENAAAVRRLIGGIAIAVIAVVLIIFSRGYINYANRMDFIARRLEAYPRMRGRKENPYIEANIFNSMENVDLDAVIGFKKDGIKHSFLEAY